MEKKNEYTKLDFKKDNKTLFTVEMPKEIETEEQQKPLTLEEEYPNEIDIIKSMRRDGATDEGIRSWLEYWVDF